jgi:glycogen operon protein
MNSWDAIGGSPLPLGVSWVAEEQAFNFALYSKHATEVTLLLYAANEFTQPVTECRLDHRRHKSGRVWHCRVKPSGMAGARYYAYRVGGSNDLGSGHRFDDQKILLDPYARAIMFPQGFSRQAACQPGSNAGRAPLGVIPAPSRFDWGDVRQPIHTSDTVIYELHVRNFTRRPNSGVMSENRGTYAGVIEKIPYLKELGITTVELMPVFEQDPQEGSCWGYMPLSFFAPNQAYASTSDPEQAFDEFRAMVKALHAAGIEVILDVVYNHTTENDEVGPTYSYRGIDNDTYYLLEADRLHYRNDTGTGNTLHCANRAVRRMIRDSVHYWADEGRVDGFRFDLASIFTRNEDGSINLDDPPVIGQIGDIRQEHPIRLIAEAWDIGAYQLGRNFPGSTWLQWNGKFRDDIRMFVRGDPGKVADMMRRLYGSDDLFPDDLLNAYHAFQSVNYITCHDGFSLYDLVSHNQRHNEANGHNNTDGPVENYSWNCGVEGDVNVPPPVENLRKQQVKNFCCLLLLSNGTPMFRAGDEFLNTQKGNTNPYNQDNKTVWLDWSLLQRNKDIFRFFKLMIAFRKAHPSLGRSRFWRDDVHWYGTTGGPDLSAESRVLAFCLHGACEGDQDLYVMTNASPKDRMFTIREGRASEWYRVVDTARPGPADICEPGSEEAVSALVYRVASRSTVVLLRKDEPHAAR